LKTTLIDMLCFVFDGFHFALFRLIDNQVTVRDRDSTMQVRLPIDAVIATLKAGAAFDIPLPTKSEDGWIAGAE